MLSRSTLILSRFVARRQQSLTNEGTARLGWHTEHAVTGQVLSPPIQVLVSYLAFIGLRADPGGKAKTLVADIRDALPLLDDCHVEALRSPEFRMSPPLLVRSTLSADNQVVGPQPILTGPDGSPQAAVALYGDMVEALTDRGERALDALQHALDRVQRGISTRPGCVYLVDNRVVFHARSPYTPRYDGNDRWLLRMMVTDSLFPLRSWQKTSRRILEP